MVSWHWSLSMSEVITLKHQTQVLNDSLIIVLHCIFAFLNICEFAPKTLKIIWLSNLSTFNIPDEGYSRIASCAINLISTFLFYLACLFVCLFACLYVCLFVCLVFLFVICLLKSNITMIKDEFIVYYYLFSELLSDFYQLE